MNLYPGVPVYVFCYFKNHKKICLRDSFLFFKRCIITPIKPIERRALAHLDGDLALLTGQLHQFLCVRVNGCAVAAAPRYYLFPGRRIVIHPPLLGKAVIIIRRHIPARVGSTKPSTHYL